ncbi:hypothetical protein BH11ARM1_BH11ARM1_13850 [soil metagenome]
MASKETNRKLVIARNIALGVLTLAVAPFLWGGLKQFATSDPFARFRSNTPKPSNAMALKDVDIRHYRGQKLVTKANAGRLEISNDRQQFDIFDITGGQMNTDKGRLDFIAKEALWNQPLKSLFIKSGAEIKNKDMDLVTENATLNEGTGIILAPGAIRGKLYDGQVQAVKFRYNSKTGDFVVGKTSWQGLLAMKLQDGQTGAPLTHWELEGDSSVHVKDNTTYENGVATDGEIILKAPKVEHNQKTDVVTATGGVYYYSGEADLFADQVVVFRKEKRAVLTGHVRMLVKPEDQQDDPVKIEPIPEFKLLEPDKVVVKPSTEVQTADDKKKQDELRSSEAAKKYPTQIYSDHIEYWYGKGNRHAKIDGNPQARQDFTSGSWRHLWSDHATYDGEKDELTLISGNARRTQMKNSTGDDVTADTFTTSTKKDDDSYSGKKIKASIYHADDDDTRSKKPKDDKGTPPPTVPPVVPPPDKGTGTGSGTKSGQ